MVKPVKANEVVPQATEVKEAQVPENTCMRVLESVLLEIVIVGLVDLATKRYHTSRLLAAEHPVGMAV